MSDGVTRSDELWEFCQGWFEGEDGDETEIHFYFGGVTIDRLKLCFETIHRESLISIPTAIGLDTQSMPAETGSLSERLDQVAAGEISVLALVYLYNDEDCALRMSLRVEPPEPGEGIGAHSETKLGLLMPGTQPREEKFAIVVAHAEQLAEMLRPERVELLSADGEVGRVVVEFG